jgi:1-aminocyclopropane-1-carboxylate deaminase/D-cysteine desulfhydrase-like pyridoxal-dependent ACC family enzyme
MSLAGIVVGLQSTGRDTPVLGVRVGADPTKRLNTYAPGWRKHATLTPSGTDYHTRADHTRLGQLLLDPIYEAKCLPHLQPGDLLWTVGIRSTGQ